MINLAFWMIFPPYFIVRHIFRAYSLCAFNGVDFWKRIELADSMCDCGLLPTLTHLICQRTYFYIGWHDNFMRSSNHVRHFIICLKHHFFLGKLLSWILKPYEVIRKISNQNAIAPNANSNQHRVSDNIHSQ